MRTEKMKQAIETGVNAALKTLEVERVKESVEEVIENGMAKTRRAIKDGRRNADELIEAASDNVKEHPMRAVGVTFGIGLGLGTIIGLLVARNGRAY
jgi:ElaB/YqjD/DUF883 family membrane-anchored ribosome-binding protein